MYRKRLTQIRQWLDTHDCNVAYLNDPSHIAYFTGYLSNPHERILGLFIPVEADPFLFTPALEVEDAQNSPWEHQVIGYLDSENPWNIIASALKERIPGSTNFAIEKSALPVANLEALESKLAPVSFKGDLTPLIEEMLLIKSLEEKKVMMEAGHWADVAFDIGFKAVKAGAKEFEIIAEIEYHLKRQGVSKMSFGTLVLAGANAASPHGTPSENTVKPNELVLFDLGVVWKGYTSDATRTIAYKEPTAFQQEIYNIVLEANLAAMTAIRPGVMASELDRIARDTITSHGYGDYFNHRLGHGIGTTVHEFPSIVAGNDMLIQEGMCFSIEPGIYIPGKVGVRIEDCVYVTKDGYEAFTTTSKALKIIN